MKILFALCLYVSISFIIFAQEQYSNGLIYHTTEDIGNFNYAEALDNLAKKSRIVGLGECTHGTAECTHIRKEIAQLLVTKYNYKHFILENGVVQCGPINDYLTSGTGRADIALLIHAPWPFAIQELFEVIEWLREYNRDKPDSEQVKFYGMDVEYGLLRQVRREYKFNGYSVIKTDTAFLSELDSINSNNKTREQHFYTLLDANAQKMSPADSFNRANIIRTYICYTMTGGALRKYREELMFDNSCYIINNMPPGEKAMIWAHNSHVSKNIPAENLWEKCYRANMATDTAP